MYLVTDIVVNNCNYDSVSLSLILSNINSTSIQLYEDGNYSIVNWNKFLSLFNTHRVFSSCCLTRGLSSVYKLNENDDTDLIYIKCIQPLEFELLNLIRLKSKLQKIFTSEDITSINGVTKFCVHKAVVKSVPSVMFEYTDISYLDEGIFTLDTSYYSYKFEISDIEKFKILYAKYSIMW